MEEKDWITRAQQGDLQAFEQLVRQYQNKIYAVALRFCGDAEDARDAAQETVIKLYRVLGKYRHKAAFSTWVYAVAKNTTLDLVRKRGRKQGIETNIEGEEYRITLPVPGPEEDYGKKEQRELLRSLILQLPEKQRAVLVLRDIDGYAYEEIAGILAISEGTVKSRLSRAREALRKAYTDATREKERR